MKVRALNAVDAQAVADLWEEVLTAAYERALRAAGKTAAARFKRLSVASFTAAAEETPNWAPPDIDELVDLTLIAGQTAKLTAPVHVRSLTAVMGAYGSVIGDPSFDVTNPYAKTLLAKIGGRSGDVARSVRDDLAKTIGAAYEQGLSVVDTARQIVALSDQFAPAQARMLARTDLNGIANGGSVLAAQEVGVQFKTWLTAADDLVRPTHQDADGQTVPIDQPFDVGGEALDFPGDPSGSDAECCNCRCVVTYSDSLGNETDGGEEALAAAAKIGGAMEPAQITIPLTVTVGEAQPVKRTQNLISDAYVRITPDVTPFVHSPSAPIADQTFNFDEFSLTAAADGEIAWTATLCVEGVPTVDSGVKRLLAHGGGDWLPLPLPLAIMYDSPHAHAVTEAPICGRIDQIWRAGAKYQAAGVFGSDEVGQKAAAYVADRRITGVSIDPVDVTVEQMLYVNGGVVDFDEVVEAVEPLDGTPGEASEPPMETPMPAMEILNVFTSYKIAGATICPVQALTDATISIVAGGSAELTNATEWTVAKDESFVAATVPIFPPAEWFDDPQLDQPTRVTVTDDGRVFGHVAPWRGCHNGYPGRCLSPPRSRTGYAQFHVGNIKTADGELLPVGRLTLAGSHASTVNTNTAAAMAHYDHTGTVAAFVRAGEDAHGIWISGALRSGISEAMIQDLLANPLSGDWRNGEMIAAHAVPVPGLPILQASAIGEDGEEQTALILTSTIGLEADLPLDPVRARVLAARAHGGVAALAELAHA